MAARGSEASGIPCGLCYCMLQDPKTFTESYLFIRNRLVLIELLALAVEMVPTQSGSLRLSANALGQAPCTFCQPHSKSNCPATLGWQNYYHGPCLPPLGAGETVVSNRQLQLWQMGFLNFLMDKWIRKKPEPQLPSLRHEGSLGIRLRQFFPTVARQEAGSDLTGLVAAKATIAEAGNQAQQSQHAHGAGHKCHRDFLAMLTFQQFRLPCQGVILFQQVRVMHLGQRSSMWGLVTVAVTVGEGIVVTRTQPILADLVVFCRRR